MLGKEVGNQAVANVVREGPKDAARLLVPAGEQRQPLQADHRVAAPVGEPVVAGDDRRVRNVVVRPAGGGLARRRDDERVGREHQFVGRARAQAWLRPLDQLPPARLLLANRVDGAERRDLVPGFRRGDQPRLAIPLQVDAEVAGAPRVSARS